MSNIFQITARIWLYHGMAGWHFVSIPKDQSAQITKLFGALKRGWGSLKVKITIGTTTWDTSIFPDKKTGEYVLPLKSEVRKKEKISVDDTINLQLEIKI